MHPIVEHASRDVHRLHDVFKLEQVILGVRHAVEPQKRDATKFGSRCARNSLCQGPTCEIIEPAVEFMAFCSYKVKRYSIWVSNVLVSLYIYYVSHHCFDVHHPRGIRALGSGVNSGVERLVEAMFLQELVLGACCIYVQGSFATGMYPDMERGCIGVMGL